MSSYIAGFTSNVADYASKIATFYGFACYAAMSTLQYAFPLLAGGNSKSDDETIVMGYDYIGEQEHYDMYVEQLKTSSTQHTHTTMSGEMNSYSADGDVYSLESNTGASVTDIQKLSKLHLAYEQEQSERHKLHKADEMNKIVKDGWALSKIASYLRESASTVQSLFSVINQKYWDMLNTGLGYLGSGLSIASSVGFYYSNVMLRELSFTQAIQSGLIQPIYPAMAGVINSAMLSHLPINDGSGSGAIAQCLVKSFDLMNTAGLLTFGLVWTPTVVKSFMGCVETEYDPEGGTLPLPNAAWKTIKLVNGIVDLQTYASETILLQTLQKVTTGLFSITSLIDIGAELGAGEAISQLWIGAGEGVNDIVTWVSNVANSQSLTDLKEQLMSNLPDISSFISVNSPQNLGVDEEITMVPYGSSFGNTTVIATSNDAIRTTYLLDLVAEAAAAEMADNWVVISGDIEQQVTQYISSLDFSQSYDTASLFA